MNNFQYMFLLQDLILLGLVYCNSVGFGYVTIPLIVCSALLWFSYFIHFKEEDRKIYGNESIRTKHRT